MQTNSYTVTSLAQMRTRAEWRHATLHSKPYHQLFWFTRGQGRFTISAVTRGYGPNTAVFVPAGTMLSFELGPQVQGVALQLPSDAALALPELPFHIRVTTVDAQTKFNSYIDMIERELADQAPARAQALTAWGLLISVWMARQLAHQSGQIRREKTHALAERYASMIERGFRDGFSVADYAYNLGVTPTHLSRICRESAGRPALAILQERVVHEACKMLVDSEIPAQEVAKSLGYSSPAYFTRSFSRLTGRTPSEFRRLAPMQQSLRG